MLGKLCEYKEVETIEPEVCKNQRPFPYTRVGTVQVSCSTIHLQKYMDPFTDESVKEGR